MGALLSSCTVSNSFITTGAPIGTKTGVAKFGKATAQNAAADGNITKIGAIQMTRKVYLVFPATITKVYGE